MTRKPAEEGKRQTVMVSPRNGAVCPTMPPGKTGNPAGSSMKARAKAAFKRAMTEAALDGSLEGLLAVARDPAQGGALVAANKLIWDRLLGPVGPQGEVVVTVRTEIGFAPRTDGQPTPKPMRAPQVESDAPKMLRNPDAD